MKLVSKLTVFTALLVLVNIVATFVLESNLRNGVYPVNADSIGIPLAETETLSFVGAALLLAITILPFLAQLLRTRVVSQLLHLFAVGIVALAYLLAAAFFALWSTSWFIPHHYAIAASCGLVVVAVLFYAVTDYRSLRPNNSFKPTCLRHAA